MDFLRNLFGQKKQTRPRPSSAQQGLDPAYLQHLKSEFGVSYGEGGWGFEGGRIMDHMATESRPDICLAILKRFRDTIPFSQVCIVIGPKMVVLVSNTKPTPTCLVTGLDASATGKFLGAAAKEGGKVEVHEDGPWLLTL